VPEDEPNPQPNPMGMVPMVELPNRPLLLPRSDLDVSGVMDMQDAVNLIWAQLFNASDFASFAQRIVLGAEVPKTPILDENGQKIGERPIDLRSSRSTGCCGLSPRTRRSRVAGVGPGELHRRP
jgi:hypothetical protein